MPRCDDCKHAGDLHREVYLPGDGETSFVCVRPDCPCVDYEPELGWEPT